MEALLQLSSCPLHKDSCSCGLGSVLSQERFLFPSCSALFSSSSVQMHVLCEPSSIVSATRPQFHSSKCKNVGIVRTKTGQHPHCDVSAAMRFSRHTNCAFISWGQGGDKCLKYNYDERESSGLMTLGTQIQVLLISCVTWVHHNLLQPYTLSYYTRSGVQII